MTGAIKHERDEKAYINKPEINDHKRKREKKLVQTEPIFKN